MIKWKFPSNITSQEKLRFHWKIWTLWKDFGNFSEPTGSLKKSAKRKYGNENIIDNIDFLFNSDIEI